MNEQVVKNRAVQKSVSLWTDQLARLERLFPEVRTGRLSRVLQEALDEKLDRTEADKELETRLRAS